VLIRRAAEALGTLRAPEAVLDLIVVLKARRVKHATVSAAQYFGKLPIAFGVRYTKVGTAQVPVDPRVAVPYPDAMLEEQRPRMEVTVFRTEVLEALREITGQDFGFDEGDWSRWYEEHKP